MKLNTGNIDNIYNRSLTEAASASPVDKKNTKEVKNASNLPDLQDKVQISDKAKVYSIGKSLANTVVKQVSEPIASEKLLKLKKEISNGSYSVPADEIAAAILGYQKYN
jgi:Anti-sigma-28 factor, FlgM.